MRPATNPPRKLATASGRANQLRIIGGRWRGRRLTFASVEGLRPTPDRVRETLFNWLMADIAGAQCLDLFSGSGALGLEALSRGAAAVTLLEQDPMAARQIAANLQLLQADNAELVETDTLQWLQLQPRQRYDIVFLDPPFSLGLWHRCLELLLQHGWLTDSARLYMESPRQRDPGVPQGWRPLRTKQAGDVCFRLLEVVTS